ncbi:hypothetical protein A5646_26530 [Mycobacterium sp. 1245499.0]|uniref:hypothetical protein n=1 Tax=Mycobacterium sp. 1245499.0 TaxID=1834074 RepID=UPI000800BBA8|nr:hypothetical protein [Mycobacterium sp. 1245499.0]OBK95010.1 hypothetical protein A5646_26530 [Mycobacterium sp. 1245499.0]
MPTVIAQCGPGALGTDSVPPLQDRHDLVDERRNLLRQRRSHARELVGRACVLPRDDMIGEPLRRADECVRRPVMMCQPSAYAIQRIAVGRAGLEPATDGL